MPIIFSTTTPASPACQPPARIYFEAPDDALLARVTEKVAELVGRHLSYTFHDEAPGGVTPIILEDVGPSAQPGAVYAELHEPDATTVGLGAVWNRHSMRDFADRTHAARLRCKSEQARLATLWGYVRADAAPKQAAPKAAPVEQDDHQILAITTAYEQGVGKGHQAYNSGKEIANPYSPAYRCDLAWQYGYKEGKEQAQREAKAAPQQEAQEPAMIYHGRCTIDCGEGGHHDMEMLRMIPAGSKLYTAPQPAQGFRRGQAAAKQEG